MDTSRILRGEDATVLDESGGYASSFSLSHNQLLGLCAAPNRSQVTLRRVDSWVGMLSDREKVPPGLHVVVKSEHIRDGSANEFVVFREPNGSRASVYLKLIDFKTGGYGGPLVRRIATEASRAGMVRLRLLAAGGRLWEPREDGSHWLGYSAWPKYGFDMLLCGSPRKENAWKIAEHFPYAPQGLATCCTVQQVRELQTGRDYWKVCGNGSYMEFDLSAKSRAWSVLNLETGGGSGMTTDFDDDLPDWEGQPAGFASARSTEVHRSLVAQPLGWLQSLDDADTDASVLSVMQNRRRVGAELLEG